MQSLLRVPSLWPHRNVSLCSICWEPANRRLLFSGTHSFALWPGRISEAHILHADKLNLGLNVPPLGLTRCVLIATAPPGDFEPMIICICKQQIASRDIASKPLMTPLQSRAQLGPRGPTLSRQPQFEGAIRSGAG